MYFGELVEIGPAEAVFQLPHHPYTEALLSAIPSLDLREIPSRIRLQGDYPNMVDPPTGCRFHTRCPRQLGEICRTDMPPWQDDPSGNRYRCHIVPGELLKIQSRVANVAKM